jgi:hypothetical protein
MTSNTGLKQDGPSGSVVIETTMLPPRENVIIVLAMHKTKSKVLNLSFLSLISFQLKRGQMNILPFLSFVCIRGVFSVITLSASSAIF